MKLSLPLELGCVNPHKQRGGLLCPCNRRCPPNQHIHIYIITLWVWIHGQFERKKEGKKRKKKTLLLELTFHPYNHNNYERHQPTLVSKPLNRIELF